MNSTTAQPLQQAATDNIMLFLEEFTGVERGSTGVTLRDIVNKNAKNRGNMDGTNTSYNFRSGLFID